jgi:acyl carrier protein
MNLHETTIPSTMNRLLVHDDAEFRAKIRRELKSIRRDLPPVWDDDADFLKDMGLDSLDLVEMVARLEQVTGIHVPDEDIPHLKSISTTSDYVRMRRLARLSSPVAGAPRLPDRSP